MTIDDAGKLRFLRCGAAAVALAGVLAGCAGPGGSVPAIPGAVPAARAATLRAGLRDRKTALTVRFSIPRLKAPGSIGIAAFNAARTSRLFAATIATVPGNANCGTVVAGRFTCKVQLPPSGGDVSLDAKAFAGASGTGTATPLLARYDVQAPTTFSLGTAPASVAVTLLGNSIFAHGSAASGFEFGGVGPLAVQYLQVAALDARGDVVVAPGAPELALGSADTAHVSVSAVTGTLGRAFAVEPLAESSGPVKLVATATSGGTSVRATFGATMQPILYVIDCWNTTVSGYAPWAQSPIVTLDEYDDIAANSAMALDAKGNLYLANHVGAYPSQDGVVAFAPGKTKPFRKIANVNQAQFLAVDASGDIFVNENNQDVEEFTPAGGNVPSRVLSPSTSPSGIDTPYGLAVDPGGNLYVANGGGSVGVSVYAPGTSTTPTVTFASGTNAPQWLALDGAGKLYVASGGGNSVVQYAPPFSASSAPAKTFGSNATVSGPLAIAVDGNGNLYVVNGGNQTIVEFAAAGPVLRTITGMYFDGTNLVATDPLNRVYLPLEGPTQQANVYAPGTSTKPMTAYTQAMDGPMDVAVWP